MEPQFFSSAKQVAEHAEQERKKNAELEARVRAQALDIQKQRQLDTDRENIIYRISQAIGPIDGKRGNKQLYNLIESANINKETVEDLEYEKSSAKIVFKEMKEVSDLCSKNSNCKIKIWKSDIDYIF